MTISDNVIRAASSRLGGLSPQAAPQSDVNGRQLSAGVVSGTSVPVPSQAMSPNTNLGVMPSIGNVAPVFGDNLTENPATVMPSRIYK